MAGQPLLLLEHLNLTVADKDVAIAFYVDGLGCQLNSKTNNERITHVNFGLSQFHLPHSSAPDTAQTWAGVIHLITTEPLSDIADRVNTNSLLKEHGVKAVITAAPGPKKATTTKVDNANADDAGNSASGEKADVNADTNALSVEQSGDATAQSSLELQVTGPYGNSFRIRSAPDLNHSFSFLGHHLGGSAKMAMMDKVVHFCQPGTART